MQGFYVGFNFRLRATTTSVTDANCSRKQQHGIWRPCFCFLVISLVSLASTSSLRSEERFDLVIRNGKIVDGSGNPWFTGDIGLKGDRITALGRIPRGMATRDIDASGFVIAPGFIDIHSHSDLLILEDGLAQSKIRQGVTTEILGEGDSAAPAQGKLPPRKATVNGATVRWTTMAEYFDTLDRSRTSVNLGSYVGLGTVWRCVMGDSFERPTPAQIQQMKDLLRQALDDGALGMSSMLAMPPGSLTTTDDIVELCSEVARAGGIYSSHIRNEGTEVFEAIKEAIEIGERAGVPVDIIHLKIADQKYWGRMNEIIALIEAARARGVNIQANVYPYTRGNNDLSSIIPPWAHEGGKDKLLERLQDAGLRERIKREIRDGLPGWYNHYTAVGGDWSRMLISKETTLKGLTMDRVLASRIKGKSPTPDLLDEFIEYLILEQGRVSTVYAHHTEEDMNLAMLQPWCSIGSDGSALAIDGPLRRGNPHPRSFGTFPRVLGVYVREHKLLRLEDAVRKMTSLNAAKVGIRDRGLIRTGNYADLVLFRENDIIDQATYTEPFQYGLGIQFVIVNGTIVIENGKHTGQKPGRAIRREAVSTPAPLLNK